MNNYKKLTPLLFTFLALYCHYTVPSAGDASAAQAAGAGQGVGTQMALTVPAPEPLTMFGVPAHVIAAAAAGKGAHAKAIHSTAPEQSPLSRAFNRLYPQGFGDQKYRTELLDRIYCQEDEPTYTIKFSHKDGEGITDQNTTNSQWSADGNLLIMVSGENCASIYYPKKGTEIKLNHGDQVSSVGFSADSKYALTGSLDGTVCIWDVHTGSKKFTLLMPMGRRGCSEFGSRAAWSPDVRWIATKSDNYSVNMWDVSHLTDPKVQAECKAFKEGTLHPAQYMLLTLLENHNQKAHAIYEKWEKEKNPKGMQSTLPTIMELSQEQAPGVSLKHAIDTLTMFGTTLRRSILKSYAIDEAKLVFALAKEKLFEESQQSAQTATSKPLLQGDTVETILREYLLGVYETAHDTEQREKAEQTRKENQAFKTQVAQAKKLKTECPVKTEALFQAIHNCDHQQVQENLNPETVIVRPMEAGKNAQGKVMKTDMRTPLMEVIIRNEQGYAEYDAIFNTLLNFKGETLLEGNIKVARESDLNARDLHFNTPLMLAINMKRFDYALKIAQKMDSDQQWYAAFNAKDKGGKTAYDLLQAVTAKQDGQSVDQATTMAQLQSIIVKHKKVAHG